MNSYLGLAMAIPDYLDGAEMTSIAWTEAASRPSLPEVAAERAERGAPEADEDGVWPSDSTPRSRH